MNVDRFDQHDFLFQYGDFTSHVIYGRSTYMWNGFITLPEKNISCFMDASADWKSNLFDDEDIDMLVRAGVPKEAASTLFAETSQHYQKYLASVDSEGKGVWQHWGENGRYVLKGEILAQYEYIGEGYAIYLSSPKLLFGDSHEIGLSSYGTADQAESLVAYAMKQQGITAQQEEKQPQFTPELVTETPQRKGGMHV